jgi:phage protein D
MGNNYTLTFGGQPADDTVRQLLASTEVEESMDMPAAIQITLPVSRSNGGDLTFVADPRFAPQATVSLVAAAGGSGVSGAAAGAVGTAASALGGGAAPAAAQCIFDGYFLSQKLHLETGVTNSTLTVWGQDASWLMNQTETVKEWVDVTDADVAASIFSQYGITPSDQNTDGGSPSYTEDTHSLMQRGSDIAFLRSLARRSGKVCRIACADQPGQRTGYFVTPKLTGDPVVNLAVNDDANWTVSSLDLEWDAARPTTVTARSALYSDNDSSGVSGDASDSGLPLLADRSLATFVGGQMTVLLAAAVDSAGALNQRAQGVLRESGWFVRCEGEADAERLGVVLRAGMLVKLVGIGALHSGLWIVWTVRHRFNQDKHTMRFTLLRNAIGSPPSSGLGGLSAQVGAS